MAFENINWMAPAQAKQLEQAQFQDMLGKAISSYQQGKELDLKRRQMEMEGIDVQKVAENALVKQNMGMELTAKEQAAIQTMGQIGRPQVYTDSFGQQVVQPSPWASLTGTPSPMPQGGNGQFAGMVGGDMPPITQDQFNAPYPSQGKTPLGLPLTADMVGGEAGIDMNRINAARVENANRVNSPAPDLKVEGGLAGTPRGALMEAEAALKFQGEKAKIDYEKNKDIEIDMFKEISRNNKAIPLIQDMISQNRKTVNLPYAESLQVGTRFLSSDQADAFDLLNQNRLELAAPLAKALGVNPTDKDFQASLDRIVNLNSTKEGREKQLKNLLARMSKKDGAPEKPQLSPEQARAELERRKKLKGQ